MCQQDGEEEEQLEGAGEGTSDQQFTQYVGKCLKVRRAKKIIIF
jgi:hypothetical protein